MPRGDGGRDGFQGVPDTGLTNPFDDRNLEITTRRNELRDKSIALIKSNTSLSARDVRKLTKKVEGRARPRFASGGKGETQTNRQIGGFGGQESLLEELRKSDRASRSAVGNDVGERTQQGGGVGAGAVGTFGRGVISTNVIKKRRGA